MSGFGSDGASVMVGRRSGVATRLKETNPSLTVSFVHCICHWLALASKDAFYNSEIPYLKKYEEILTSLFKFYHNTSVRAAGLREIQHVCEDPQLKLKEAKHVRYHCNICASILCSSFEINLYFSINFLQVAIACCCCRSIKMIPCLCACQLGVRSSRKRRPNCPWPVEVDADIQLCRHTVSHEQCTPASQQTFEAVPETRCEPGAH